MEKKEKQKKQYDAKKHIQMTGSDRVMNGGFYLFITVFSIICLIPFLLVLGSSFTAERALTQNGYNIWPSEFSLDAYKLVFVSGDIPQAYLITVGTTIVGTFFSMVFTCGAAYAMSVKNFKSRGVLALFIYRLTIEALGKVRFIVPLSIVFALWAGTRPEFTTYLSSSRIVVFFPFFVAGYLWKSDYTDVVRKFKGKWILLLVSALLLYAVPNFMIANEIPVDIFRGNHTYQISGMDDITGMLIRLLMYLVSFVLVLTFLALIPDVKLPVTFVGRNTMGIYFFHYPIMIVLNGLLLLSIPQMLNVWVLFGVSWVLVLILGSKPVSFLYGGVLNLLTFILFKRERQVQDEGLEDEYDEDDRYEIILKRKKAIEELAATLDEEDARKVKDDVAAVLEHETEETEEIRGEDFFVDEDLEMEEGMDDAGAPQEFEQLQDLDDILKITEPQGEMEVLLKNKEEKAQD